MTIAPWQRQPAKSLDPPNQPPPPVPDYGPPAPSAPQSQTPLRPAARSVPYQQVPTTADRRTPRPAGRGWAPAGAAVAAVASASVAPAPARPGARASWVLPHPANIMQPVRCHQFGTPLSAPLPADWINYDPPPESAGTGLQQTNPDGSWVVHPLSVIHPGSRIGDEGPINEAFLSTPVVYLCAGRPYALSSPVVVPDGATLHLNRAAIDREQITVGEGAIVVD